AQRGAKGAAAAPRLQCLARAPAVDRALVGEGVELDLQIGQMTLRSKHLSALDTDVATHEDVRAIFGEATIQASLLERAEHCQRYRLV
mgnify:CR=1